MGRAYITVDETNPNLPTARLHVGDQVLTLSEIDLAELQEGCSWALGSMGQLRARYWQSLTTKNHSRGGQ